MPDKSHDDLAEMLNDLAESQKRQEAELHELAGGNPNPPALQVDDDEPIDAVLADETTKLDRSGNASAMEAGPTFSDDAPIEAEEAPAAAPAPVNPRPVDELRALQNDPAASADMLAELAQQTGHDDNAKAPAVFEDEPAASEEPQVIGGPTFERNRPSPRPAARRSTRPPAKPAANMKAVFAPVLLTFGILTLVPAIWAVLILMGVETWMSKGQGVDSMAKLMLVCWPVSLGLLAGAIVSFVQVAKEKSKERARAAAMQSR